LERFGAVPGDALVLAERCDECHQIGRPIEDNGIVTHLFMFVQTVVKWLISVNARMSAVRHSELPRSMRKDLARAEWRLSAPRRLALPNPIRLMGYNISYFGAFELYYLFEEIFESGTYLFNTDRRRPCILDCGSHIGMSILFFKRLYPEARIIGFEADPLTFEKLRFNIEQNGLRDVVLNHCALTDEDGSAEFFRGKNGIGGGLHTSLREERKCNDGERLAVPARRLSSFISEEVDLLKLDVEGAEFSVIRDLADAGKLQMIRQIHLEYHHHIDSKEDKLSDLLAVLENNGFGYQIAGGRTSRWPKPGSFQDISLYCYRKQSMPGVGENIPSVSAIRQPQCSDPARI
jgi:FkbM family methyltransferase